MKVRIGFVTNSSSSSFVIMYRQMPEIDKETMEKYPFLRNYLKTIEKAVFDEDRKITNEKELADYFVDNYGWREVNTIEKLLKAEPYYKDRYNEYKKHLDNGFNITFKDVDYDDEGISDMLWSLNDGINFIVESDN